MRKTAVVMLLILALAAFLPTACFQHAAALPEAGSGYINDYASVLDSGEEEALEERFEALRRSSGVRVVVSTVQFTGARDADEYAYDMFTEWGLGDNTLLILLVTEVGDYRFVRGEDLYDVLSTATLNAITDASLASDFAQGDCASALMKTAIALSAELSEDSVEDDGDDDGDSAIGDLISGIVRGVLSAVRWAIRAVLSVISWLFGATWRIIAIIIIVIILIRGRFKK